MTWSNQFTKYNYLCFVVWWDTPFNKKKRVIVNIKKFNKIFELNNYLMPLQSEIIDFVIEYRYIFIIDATS